MFKRQYNNAEVEDLNTAESQLIKFGLNPYINNRWNAMLITYYF